MTSDLRAAAQQALEALESADWYINQLEQIVYSDDDTDTHEERAKVQAAINALRAALAEPVQEPVAWRWGYRSVTTGEMDWRGYVEIAADPKLRSPAIMEPLYTAPPQRKPLSDEDAAALIARDHRILKEFGDAPSGAAMELIRAVERAHGIT